MNIKEPGMAGTTEVRPTVTEDKFSKLARDQTTWGHLGLERLWACFCFDGKALVQVGRRLAWSSVLVQRTTPPRVENEVQKDKSGSTHLSGRCCGLRNTWHGPEDWAGGDDKWLDPRCILKVEPPLFKDGSDVVSEKRERIKTDDSKFLKWD